MVGMKREMIDVIQRLVYVLAESDEIDYKLVQLGK